MPTIAEAPDKIFLAEDSDDWTQKVEAAAHELGAKVVRSSEYRDAMEKLEKGMQEFDVAIFDCRLGHHRTNISRLVQYVVESDGFKPSPIALTGYPGDISKETKHHLVATLDKGDIRNDPGKLKKEISDAFRQNAYDRGMFWWKRHVQDLPPPQSIQELARNLPLALGRVPKRHRKLGLWVQAKIDRFCRVRGVASFDCIGYVTAVRDDRVEVALQIEAGKEERRSFDAERFSRAGLLYSGAKFRYQIIEGPQGDVLSRLKPWLDLENEKIDFDASVFESFDATRKVQS